MSTEKLRAVTAMRDAWETARVCLWHKINALLAEKETRARLPVENRTGAPISMPPKETELASAISALRVAARSFALHFDVTDQSRCWLYVGNCPMRERGLLWDPGRLEHYLQEMFGEWAACELDADFWQRQIVEPTIKHAEEIRAALNSELEEASAAAPEGGVGRSPRKGTKKKATLKDIKRMLEVIREHGVTTKAATLIKKAKIEKPPGLRALRKLESDGKYHGFRRKKRTKYAG